MFVIRCMHSLASGVVPHPQVVRQMPLFEHIDRVDSVAVSLSTAVVQNVIAKHSRVGG